MGRFISVDPIAEATESMGTYQYADNNPIMLNDPMGDLGKGPSSHVVPATNWAPILTNNLPTDIQASINNFDSTDSGVINGNENYLSDLNGDNGVDAQAAAVDAQYLAGQFAGSTPLGMAAQINALVQPYAAQFALGNISYSPHSGLSIFYTTGKITYDDYGVISSGGINGVTRSFGDLGANQGGANVSLISGPFNTFPRTYLDAKFYVSGVRASNLQYIQVVHYPGHNILDGGGFGKPYYYTPYQMRAKTYVNWDGSSGTIETLDQTNAYQVLPWVSFEALIVAVNYNNTGYDKVLADFTWGFTGQNLNSQTIKLNPTASPQALQIIQLAYPGYKIK